MRRRLASGGRCPYQSRVRAWQNTAHAIARRRPPPVTVEIIDGSALAEWLAEPELYWIAQEYLHLPAELAPQADQPERDAQLPPWYVELRRYWQEPGRQPVNLGDLFDLRHGLGTPSRRVQPALTSRAGCR